MGGAPETRHVSIHEEGGCSHLLAQKNMMCFGVFASSFLDADDFGEDEMNKRRGALCENVDEEKGTQKIRMTGTRTTMG